MRCPGSSLEAPNPLDPFQVPLIECSGQGQCTRDPPTCRQGESCLAYCVCAGTFSGADCSLTPAQLAERRGVRSRLLQVMITAFDNSDHDSETVAQQIAALTSLVSSAPSELSEADRSAALSFATNLAAVVSPTDITSLTSAMDLIGALSSQSLKDAKAASDAVVVARRLYQALVSHFEEVSMAEGYAREDNETYANHNTSMFVRSLVVHEPNLLSVRWPHSDLLSDNIHVLDWVQLPSDLHRGDSLVQLRQYVNHVLPRRLTEATSSAVDVQSQANRVLDTLAGASLAETLPNEAPITLESAQVALSMTRGGGEAVSIVSPSGLGVRILSDDTVTWNTTSGTPDTITKAWKLNPYSAVNTTLPAAAPLTSLEIRDGDAVYPVSGRSVPIVLTISVPSDTDTTEFRCSYWDLDSNDWSTSGAILLGYLVQDDGDVYASCGTLHLSDFSGVADPSFLALPNPAEFLDVGMLGSLFDPKNLVPVVVIFTLIGFFLLSWALSFHQDRKLGDKMTALRRAHHLLYGQVTGGFGRDKLHLDMDERGKDILKRMEESFRVRCLCGFSLMVDS
jgi:hypothetical protein